MWSLRVTPIVGLPTYTDWSQAATFHFDSGKFAILLSVHGQSAAVLGQSVLNELETAPPESVEDLHTMLTDLQENHPDEVFSAACVLVTEEKVTLGTLRAGILLHRDLTTGTVLPVSAEISLRSGKRKPDDVYILLNEQAEQFVPAIEQHFAKGLLAEVVATLLVPAVQSSLRDSGAAAIALVEVAEKFVEPVVPEPIREPLAETAISEPEITASSETTTQPKRVHFAALISRVLSKSNQLGVKLWLVARSLRFHKSGVYVQTELQQQWRRRLILYAGIGLFVMLLVVGFWWWSRTQQAAARAELAPFEERLFFAQNLVNSEPLAARQEVSKVVAELETLASTKGTQRFVGTRYTTALTQAQEVLTAISGKVAVDELPIFYDLRLAQSEMVTSSSHGADGKGVFIDAEKKRAVVLDLASKKVQLLDVSALSQVQATAVGDDSLYILSDGIWQLAFSDNATPQEIKSSGDSNKGGALLGSFGSFLYVLNPEKRNVFRYTQTADSVSDPIGWIIDPLPVSYDTISAMSIDGEIWFGSDAGEIFRYASGRREKFATTGLEEAFSSTLLLATLPDSEKIYVLETSKQRLVILNKDGTFLREVKSPSIATVTSFFVDEVGGFAYLTSGSTVYQIAVAE
ncbi:MAG: hypothetical protein O2840_02205 [bacterium]|nr:hypothetical protein [bacterium]